MQVTIGAKYQIVLPKEIRKKMKGIKPGNKVNVYPIDEETLGVKVSKQNWSDKNYGAFKKYWKGIDMTKEVEEARDEWEERLKELGR